MKQPTPFTKVQSIGNDFVLVHQEDWARLAEQFVPLDAFARAVCDRKFGIGSDGLLLVELSAPNELTLRMFNPDGSEDFCGNGLRCAALHGHAQGWVGETFSIRHLDRSVPVSVHEDGRISTALSAVTYDPTTVPLARPHAMFDEPIHVCGRTYRASALSSGSAHTVLPVSTLPGDEEFLEVSHALEHHEWFPERTSVIWTQTTGENDLTIRIWERGAGETQGCGTGSTAAAADYLRRHDRGGEVQVHNPGGTLTVSGDAWDKTLTVTGRADEVYNGKIAPELLQQIQLPSASGCC